LLTRPVILDEDLMKIFAHIIPCALNPRGITINVAVSQVCRLNIVRLDR
jgi:hypothetical protein